MGTNKRLIQKGFVRVPFLMENVMQIQRLKVEDLKPAEYNPRKKLKPGDKEFEKLKNSIEEFGYVEPIILNKRTNTVVGGHQRLEVMKHLGYTEVDCVIVDLDEQKEKALNIALNKISGEWDNELLTDLLKELDQEGIVSITGFEAEELDALFAGTEYNVSEDNFDVGEALEQIDNKPCTQYGDIWHIKNHKLLCGDSTKLEDIERLFVENEQASLIVTDPPYNIDYGNSEQDRARARGRVMENRSILNDNMDDESFYKFLFKFYETAYAIVKGGGAIYVFHSTKESVNFIEAMKDAGFKVSQTLVWVKDHFTLGRNDYQWQHEPILYGWKVVDGKPHYFIHDRTMSTVIEEAKNINQMKKDELVDLLNKILENYPSDIVRDAKPLRNAEHPTMKPITLCGKLIRNSSREREIVFDAFAGSGSTLMACEQLNRKSYNSELSENYCDVIVRRFIQTFGEDDIYLERDGKIIELKDTKLFKN